MGRVVGKVIGHGQEGNEDVVEDVKKSFQKQGMKDEDLFSSQCKKSYELSTGFRNEI